MTKWIFHRFNLHLKSLKSSKTSWVSWPSLTRSIMLPMDFRRDQNGSDHWFQQTSRLTVGLSVGRSIGGLWGGETRKGDPQTADTPHRPTDGLTVGPSVGRTVGYPGEVKFIQRAVKSLREGDTGDKWNRRLVGRSEDRGSKQAEWESVTLESRIVGRSVGQRIGELEKKSIEQQWRSFA